jgi:alkaline phosphatase
MVSLRAHIGWSTHGHSAVDVNIYSSGGAGTEKIRGNVENTDVGKFLRSYLDVDVDSVTKELREKMGGEQRKGFNNMVGMDVGTAGYTPGDAEYASWMHQSQVFGDE